MDVKAAARELRILFDAQGYLDRYADVRESGVDPVEHYLLFGAVENRQPCDLFDSFWYRTRYPDVASSGLNSLLHYIRHGGMEIRDPNPRFHAAFYIDAHPEATGNPLLYHLLFGRPRGWPTEPPIELDGLLPSQTPAMAPPPDLVVDVVIPVYRGFSQTKRCIESVLADTDRPPGRIIVIDDASPDTSLSNWLDERARHDQIQVLRHKKNLGFVRSVNLGMKTAGQHDIVLLNSDTEVCPGWLARLTSAAYSQDDIATVSPFSNNATICSYPDAPGRKLPAHFTTLEIDLACRAANSGRVVDIPTTVGFCMYIRRAALDAVGPFDARLFGHGYGEEVDFSRRATALGWRHILACDVFVYHEGEVSFGTESAHARKGAMALRKHHPEHDLDVTRHLRLNAAHPARFAITAALFRLNRLPGILFVSHSQGGGVRRQIHEIIAKLQGKANVMLLQPDIRGVGLSVPTIEGHPVLTLSSDRLDDFAQYLQSAAIQRVHIHHLMDIGMDIQALIMRLGVPFDFTTHDYFSICPQVNLLPLLDGQYCGEPDARQCNACIAATPNNAAADIDSWRWENRWLFTEADRVICPSDDARARLIRHGLGTKAIVVPHEAVSDANWPPAPARLAQARGQQATLTIALLGVLADRKGLATVTNVIEMASAEFKFHLVGHTELAPAPGLAKQLTISGAYDDADLPNLIARLQPHIMWFPAQWPETYSYTLSAAINAGSAIVAADIGAFPERLRGRPMTWLVPPDAPVRAWLDAFAAAGKALRDRSGRKQPAKRPTIPDYYARNYLSPPRARSRSTASVQKAQIQPRVLLLPERLDNGGPSPCAYIRLLQPFNHPVISAGSDVRITDEISVFTEAADILITHRHAVTEFHEAEALIAHCRDHRIRLIYDLDDDLTNPVDDHTDAGRLRTHLPAVRQMIAGADAIWVSTQALATRLGQHRRKIKILPNALDERLWWPPATLDRPHTGPLRLLYMGTGTHAPDLDMIIPALDRLQATFGSRIAIDIIGITRADLPTGINRVVPPYLATRSYPAFVNWLSLENKWHIGLAPLVDTAFNRAKSAIKAMDYAALGLPTVASDIGVYDGVVRDGLNGLLLPNTDMGWFAGLARLIRDPSQRALMAKQAYERFLARFTLASQATMRRKMLGQKILGQTLPKIPAPR